MSAWIEHAVPVLYLLSAVLFIIGLKGLTKVRSARRGNMIAAIAMLIAVIATLLDLGLIDYRWILAGMIVGGGIGTVAALKVEMTAMPEMVALFNGSGGGASALVASAIIWLEIIEPAHSGSAASVLGGSNALTAFLSILIGSVTLSGSVVAFLKLSGRLRGRPGWLKARNMINSVVMIAAIAIGLYQTYGAGDPAAIVTWTLALTGVGLFLGIILVLPIGGADMPVVISLLNSLSGVAAAATGFVLDNNVLIIAGALVGASGLILTQIMCKAMNRTLGHVLFADFGDDAPSVGDTEYSNVRSFSAEEAAMVLEDAASVIIVPGYGLAVAQAQHMVREMADLLAARGAKIAYGVHPVAGRMPGHMNVLLAEADVPYEQLQEMDRINPEFKTTDVVLVVGANDVVNPAAETQPSSPIYGMPILRVAEARTVIMLKRSLSPGYAGVKNELFEHDNTMMLFGDAKQSLQDLVKELRELTA
ncbi:MAG: NAD(P)(+) transhydrogenase (Re/Si-specific) subunit beta [Acidobacteria bacterium]|nr:NAD(P)(+) transhydrogenase (Re/Si-specific) subunit beta [Acidobacteriota bacterium]